MMDWTDRHCRYFHRLADPAGAAVHRVLTTGAVLHGDRTRLLRFDPSEHPSPSSSAGCDPERFGFFAHLRRCGFDEINLNVGCHPIAYATAAWRLLMAEPALVGACVAAMKPRWRCGDGQVPHRHRRSGPGAALDGPPTRQWRRASTSHCPCPQAWLGGLSPLQNRSVPPLDYARVYRLKRRLPGLEVVLNGGVATVEQALSTSQSLTAVMMGRRLPGAVALLDVDPVLFGTPAPVTSVRVAAEAMIGVFGARGRRPDFARVASASCGGLFHGCRAPRAFVVTFRSPRSNPARAPTVLRDALSLIASAAVAAETAAA